MCAHNNSCVPTATGVATHTAAALKLDASQLNDSVVLRGLVNKGDTLWHDGGMTRRDRDTMMDDLPEVAHHARRVRDHPERVERAVAA